MLFSLRELIDQIEALLDDGIDWTERPVQLSLRDAENRAFGKIEQLIDRSRPFVPAGQYLRRGVQQLAQQGFVADDLAVVTDVRRARNDLHQLRQIGGAAHGFDLALRLEALGQRNVIDDFTAFGAVSYTHLTLPTSD